MQTPTELFTVLAEAMEEVSPCPINSTLFQQEDQKGITYRIPALLYIPPVHTFLAFAEKRSTSRDVDALYLVFRRGVMKGLSVQVTLPRPGPGPHLLSSELSARLGLFFFSPTLASKSLCGELRGK